MKLVRKISESLFGSGGAEEQRAEEHDETGASSEHGADRDADEPEGEERQDTGEHEVTDDEAQDEKTDAEDEHEETAGEGEGEETVDEGGGETTDSEEQGEEIDEAEADSSDSASDEEESDASDADRQQHGRHWTTLVPEENRARDIEATVKSTVEDGETITQLVQGGMNITGYRLDDGPVGTIAVVRNETVVRAYPIVEGVEHDLEVESVTEWESGLEAWIDGSLDEAPITTFAANYFAHLDSDIGDECTASLGLLAYTVRTADDDTIVTEAGTEIDISDFIGILPRQRDASDDYVVRTEIKELERVSVGEFDGYYLRVPLFRMDDGEEFDVGLFVADHVAGDYEPEVGDTIEGACWLQAWLQ